MSLTISTGKCKCKGCTERYSGCHIHCDSYKEYRQQLDDYAEKKRKAKEDNAPFADKKRRLATKVLRTKGKL